MKVIIRGILIIMVMLLVFMLMTACAPNRAMTRDNPNMDKDTMDNEKFDYSYNDEGEYPEKKNKQDKQDNGQWDYDNENKNNERNIRPRRSPRINGEYEQDEYANGNDSQADNNYYQTGMASWYGREFHGRATASGERFDMHELSAAHRALPFGTIVRVTRLDNGKSIRVRINDRGPYRNGRIIDLSFAGARQMDMLKIGEVKVGLTILRKGGNKRAVDRDRENKIAPVVGNEDERYEDDPYSKDEEPLYKNGKNNGNYSVQAGAFYSKTNALRLKQQLSRLFDNTVVVIKEEYMYKVRVEGIRNKSTAKKYKRTLEDEDIPSYIIKNSERY